MKKLIILILIIVVVLVTIVFLYQYFVLAKNEKGALQVTSSPEAVVYLDDQRIGTTPLCICGSDVEDEGKGISSMGKLFGKDVSDNLLPVGEYTVRIVPNDKNFSEFQEKIIIGKSLLTVVDRKFANGAQSEGSVIYLEPLPDQNGSELLILSIPDSAGVILDGNRAGSAPVHKTDITESNHELLLSKNGYLDKAVRIKTAKGYKLIAKIYLGVDENAVGNNAQPAASSSAETKNTTVLQEVRILSTGTGFLRVREGPSLADPEIGRVNPDEEYSLISEQDDWVQIEFEKGEVGWVSSQYVEKIED